MQISDQTLFDYCLLSFYLMPPPIFIALHFLQAPYGKHYRSGWGPTMSPPIAWFLMEGPTLWLTLLLFPLGQHHSNSKTITLISIFLIHYFHRTIIYPIRLFLHRNPNPNPKSASGVPLSVALMAFAFNLLNSYVQSRSISHYIDYENDRWFWWRFSGGLVVFVTGMAVNIWSDLVLLSLKTTGSGGGGGYKIPRGGWFEVVSCPNYFGEALEWLGWAVMTWSWSGLGFFVYTCANLMPRARANHKWYLDKFGEDYPEGRRSMFPFLY